MYDFNNNIFIFVLEKSIETPQIDLAEVYIDSDRSELDQFLMSDE